MPQFDHSHFISQLFWLAICFSVLYFFMSKVYLPRIKAILEERKKQVEADNQVSNELKEKIADLNKYSEELRRNASASYKTSLDQAFKETILSREEALNNLRKKVAKINDESENALNRFVSEQQSNCQIASEKISEAINKKLFQGNLEQIKPQTKN